MHRNSTEAVRQGRLQPFKGTGHFPSDSPTDNQLDIGASVADTKTGGSACPGALVAAGKDFASFFYAIMAHRGRGASDVVSVSNRSGTARFVRCG